MDIDNNIKMLKPAWKVFLGLYSTRWSNEVPGLGLFKA
jgi:hypothetical protein